MPGTSAPASIEGAIEAALRTPEAWPAIVLAVSSKELVALEFVRRNLVLYATTFRGQPDRAEETDSWFLEGALLFEALLAWERYSSSQKGLEELFLLGRQDGVNSVATAGLSPGTALRIAFTVLGSPKPSAAYHTIAVSFAEDFLRACQDELDRQEAEAKRGRLARWLHERFAPPGPFEAYRVEWTRDVLIQFRVIAMRYRSELGAAGEIERAEAELERLGDTPEAAAARAAFRADAGRAAFNQGKYAEAFAGLNEAVQLREGRDADPTALAEVLAARGRAADRLADTWQAVQDFDRALALMQAEGRGDTEEAAGVLLARGALHAEMNHFAGADSDLTRALSILEAHPATPDRSHKIAQALSNRGFARVRLRLLDDAISDLTRAIDLAGRMEGDEQQELTATARHNRGNAFYEQGRVSAAIDDLNEAITIRRKAAEDEKDEHLDALASVGRDLGRLVMESRSVEEALPLLEGVVSLRTHLYQARNAPETIHDLAMALSVWAGAQVKAGKLEDALERASEVVEGYRHLVNVYGLSARRLDLAAAVHLRAHVLFELGRLEQARKEESRAITLFRELAASSATEKFSPELGRALAAAGEIEEAAGQARAAAVLLEESADLLESTVPAAETEQERQHRRASFSANVRRLIHLACQLDRAGEPSPDAIPGRGATWAERAAYWSERQRARNLADLMTAALQKPFGVSADEYGEYERIRRELRDLDFRLLEMEAGLSTAPNANLTGLEREVEQARAQRFSLLTAIRTTQESFRRRDPNWAAGAPPLTIEEIAATARQCGAGLLSLNIAPQGVMAVLVRPDGTAETRVLENLKAEDVARWFVEWQLAETGYRDTPWWDRDFDRNRDAWHDTIETTLRDIGSRLWAPMRDWAAASALPAEGAPPRLVLILGVLLNQFPIHAAGEDDDRLCDQFEAIFVPSISVLRRRMGLRLPVAFDLLAARNPTAASSGLPWAEVEVDEVLRLVPDHMVLGTADDSRHPAATRRRLMEELPRHTVALLATHGVYSATASWSSSGVHTADHGGLGLMTIRDFYDIDLEAVRLVLLTACESARSDLLDLTGEQLGLPSAVLAAGAGAVVGSLWRVEDVPTALLVRQFFIELKQPSPPGAALRNAQRWLRCATREELALVFAAIRKAEDIASILPAGPRPYAHPVYWAAFGCYGGY